jgi:hypothetical protein
MLGCTKRPARLAEWVERSGFAGRRRRLRTIGRRHFAGRRTRSDEEPRGSLPNRERALMRTMSSQNRSSPISSRLCVLACAVVTCLRRRPFDRHRFAFATSQLQESTICIIPLALRAMTQSGTVVPSCLVDSWHDVHGVAFRHGVDRVVVVTQPRGAYLRWDTELLQHERSRTMAGRPCGTDLRWHTSSIRTLSICDAIEWSVVPSL